MCKTLKISKFNKRSVFWFQLFQQLFQPYIVYVQLRGLAICPLIYVIRQLLVFLAVLITFGSEGIDGGIPGYIQHPGKKPPLGLVIGLDLTPDIDEYFLQYVAGKLVVVCNNLSDYAIKRICIIIVKITIGSIIPFL